MEGPFCLGCGTEGMASIFGLEVRAEAKNSEVYGNVAFDFEEGAFLFWGLRSDVYGICDAV